MAFSSPTHRSQTPSTSLRPQLLPAATGLKPTFSPPPLLLKPHPFCQASSTHSLPSPTYSASSPTHSPSSPTHSPSSPTHSPLTPPPGEEYGTAPASWPATRHTPQAALPWALPGRHHCPGGLCGPGGHHPCPQGGRCRVSMWEET